MDKFNIILIILIFASLIVIIGIFGKNLKKFREAGKNVVSRKNFSKRDKKRGKSLFSIFLAKIAEFFVWFAEAIVSNARKSLQSAHTGLMEIKARKNLKKTAVDEDFTTKKSELKSQTSSIKNSSVSFENKIFKQNKKRAGEKAKATEGSILEKDENKDKIKDFFKKDHQDEKEVFLEEDFVNRTEKLKHKNISVIKKNNFFNKINPFKREKNVVNKRSFPEESFNDFSDGVTKVERELLEQNNNSINGVVRKKRVSMKRIEDDDELGVDRKILEKKILQKIAASPKDIEGYRQLGELYIKMKNFDDASSAYKFILRVSARDVDASRKLEKIKLLKRLR